MPALYVKPKQYHHHRPMANKNPIFLSYRQYFSWCIVLYFWNKKKNWFFEVNFNSICYAIKKKKKGEKRSWFWKGMMVFCIENLQMFTIFVDLQDSPFCFLLNFGFVLGQFSYNTTTTNADSVFLYMQVLTLFHTLHPDSCDSDTRLFLISSILSWSYCSNSEKKQHYI